MFRFRLLFKSESRAMFFLAPRKAFQYSVNISLKISVQRVPVKKEKKEEGEEISFLSYHKLTSKIFRKETNGKGSLKRISFE